MKLEGILRTSLPPLDERPEKWPDNCFDEVAKVLLPFIRDYFASEKGQQEFAEWKRQKDAEERKKKKLSKREKTTDQMNMAEEQTARNVHDIPSHLI